MKRALWAGPILFISLALWHAQGSYSYFYSENLVGSNLSNWAITGSVSTSGGLSGNGNLSYWPSNPGFGEVRLTIQNASSTGPNGDTYYAYFDLAADYTTYYVIGFTCNGSAGSVSLSERVQNGSNYIFQQLAATNTSCSASTVVRAVLKGSNTALVYVNGTLALKYSWALGSGEYVNGSRLGIGVSQTSGTSAHVTNVDLGSLDPTPPNAIPASSINKTAVVSHVDLSWPAASDDANGTGVYDYEIWRNGSFLTSTTGLTFSDTTVNPSTTYTYTLKVVDYHGNSAGTDFSITTPYILTNEPFPSATPEGRRVGVRSTGAYWGASGENIDVMSGNLNFTLPLVKAQARSGWGVGFNLTYNSQNWRYDGVSNWEFGSDVGYGFGWRLLAGSITPVFVDSAVSYYLFIDSTGAEYRLDQNSGGIWSSKESIYVYYDDNTTTLHFRDGSFWYFGCVSSGGEADSGVMHPTIMEDTNGNQVLVSYQTSPGTSWTNSSARIVGIEDVRGNGLNTYSFTYNNDSPPHLTGIISNINSGENYGFTYLTGQSLSSPFNSQSFGTTAFLRRVTSNTIGTYHEFTYNGSGEMTQILLPYKGYLSYDYTTTAYPSGRSYREVIRRYLSKDGVAQTQYTFAHDTAPVYEVHQWTTLTDPGGLGEKVWYFGTSSVGMGLVTVYQGAQVSPSFDIKVENDYTWAQDSVGNSYVSQVMDKADPQHSYGYWKLTEQTLDTHGNVTQVKRYDFDTTTNPIRTDNYTYLSTSAYTSRYIFNRLTSSPTTTISYDQFGLNSLSGLHEWDSSVQTIAARGNPTNISSLSGTQNIVYDVAGGVATSTANGVLTTVSTNSSTNYAAPSQISVGSFTTSLTYNGFLALTNETDPNGAQVSIGYDAMARPNSTTSPFGATTTNSYKDTTSPPTKTTTVNGRWIKTTMDGLGRTIKTETGYGSTTVSVAETEYDSCGCSPLGKLKRTALAHAPGANPVWTTYTYDGIGRTLTVTASGTDTTSTTTYSYVGNTVTVTDATGNWKRYAMDALGQLVQVNEPNPAGGADYVTTYGYDTLGHLTSVNMPRPTGTQTRTFNYGNPPGGQLLSATNPENGTVTYTYNSDKTLATKTDAKNQQVQYTYDSYKRVTQIKRGTLDPNNGNQFTEDACQRETYSYDTNPYDSNFSQYSQGRLTAAQYKGGYNSSANPTCDTTFTEMYSYSQAGGVVKKRLAITRSSLPSSTVNLDSTYSYDAEGRVTATQYPSTWNGSSWVAGPNLGNSFDSMGHLSALTDLASQTAIVSAATYSPAGQLLTMTGANGAPSESRTYNSIGQLTQLQSGSVNLQYAYSATQNNGKITSETDVVSGEQITYTYDSLNRLASATSSVNPGWGQSYGYDGFGNLTTQTVTKGTAPSLNVSYDPATNRQTGDCADANGNLNSVSNCANGNYYDVENRITRNSGTLAWAYSYAPGNKRVWRGVWSGSTQTVDEVTYWGATGQKLVTYQLSVYVNQLVATATGTDQYFGGKLIKNATGYVTPDRLGSIGKYFPYGQERPSATQDGKEKFATYFRDSETGLDYAQNRYHQPGTGRFMTADPYVGSASASNPASWNRYAYTDGDPVNSADPSGLCDYLACVDVSASPDSGGVQVPGWNYSGALGGGGGGPISSDACSNGFATLGYLPDYLAGMCMDSGFQPPGGVPGCIHCDDPIRPNPPPNATDLSERGLDCIKSYEGLKLNTYLDAVGRPTIGYGHLIKPGEDFSNGITQEQADDLFRSDLAVFIKAVRDDVKVDLNQNQFDALVSFAYNIGINGFAGSSVVRNLNTGNPVTEANFTAWNQGGRPRRIINGLTARRKDEYMLFSTGESNRCPN